MDNIINKIKKIIFSLRVIFVKNDLKRWAEVSKQSPLSWRGRNMMIAEFIPGGSRVLDVGCGDQNLKSFLKQGCEYQPCDLINSSKDVLVCDFNSNIYPNTDHQYDYIIMSGVLEYARDPKIVLENLSKYGDNMIISYSLFREGNSKIDRLNKGWVNHLTEKQLEDLFTQNKLNILKRHKWDSQDIYIVKKYDESK